MECSDLETRIRKSVQTVKKTPLILVLSAGRTDIPSMKSPAAGPYRAYAKINLGLFVLRKREDGYHDIATLFHRVDLYDEVELLPSPGISLSVSSPAVPADDTNLCHRAARLLQEHLGVVQGVHLRLSKSIPVGAGLGGGSADAATVLLALPGFWGVQADPGLLASLALRLGSDVPYFLGSGPAVAHGRGEILERVRLTIPFTILLCFPGVSVSTEWAYGRVQPGPSAPDLAETVTAGMKDPALLAGRLRNDFEPAVLSAFPEVAAVKRAIVDGGAVYASLSGSGSSVFGLFASPGAAQQTAERLRSAGHPAWLTAPGFEPREGLPPALSDGPLRSTHVAR